MKFQDVAERYKKIKTRRGNDKSPSAQHAIDRMIERWGKRSVNSIKAKDINDLQEELLYERGLSHATVNTYLKYLRLILNYARDRLEVLDVVPTIKTLPEAMKELYLEPGQVRSLLRWLDPLRADMVEFALCCGQRNNNVRTLRWSQISKDRKYMSIESSETKNGKPALIPLNGDARAILERRERQQEELIKRRPFLRGKIDCVFVQDNGHPFSRGAVCNKTWRKAVDLAGLPKGTSFHTLRHTFATWHFQMQTDTRELMEIGGWRSINSLQRYTHMNNRHKMQAASRIEGMLREN
jgi:integrase